MPPRWATKLAAYAPHALLYALLVVALLWAGIYLVVGQFTTVEVRVLGAAATMLAFSVTQLFQALFMIVFPATAVEERITPPQTRGNRWIDLTATSERKSRLVGILGIVGSAFGFLLAGLFASAAL